MKKLLTIFTASLMLLNTGCSYSPTFIVGAKTKPTLNSNESVNNNEFKTALIGLMNKKQKMRYAQSLYMARNNEVFNAKNRSNAADAALVASTGMSTTSGKGGAATLGLGLLGDYLDSRPLNRTSSTLYISDEWLGATLSPDKAKERAKEKVIEAMRTTFREFHYDMVCKFNCDKEISTFELTRTIEKDHPEQYFPKTLVSWFQFEFFEVVKDNELLSASVGDKYRYAVLASIHIDQPHPHRLENGKVKYDVYSHKNNYQYYNVGVNAVLVTTLGRDIYRALSKRLPTWYYGGDFIYSNFAVHNGNIYSIPKNPDHENFKGVLATN